MYGLWNGFANFPRLLHAFFRAARGKYDRIAVLQFYADLEPKLLQMRDELLAGTYRWGSYRAFYVIDPKLRLIESAPFRDRVVHHAMHEVMAPIFEDSFYAHSYACRPGRGTHASVATLRHWIGDQPDWYFLKMDVQKFFPTIDREILFGRITRKIGDRRFLELIQSLLRQAPGICGIPIGNLTSQLFANVYLDALDQYVKRVLRVPFYLRYMDDIVLLDRDLDRLRRWRDQLGEYGAGQLRQRFHPHKVNFGKVCEGIPFVGYRIYPWGVSIRGKTLRRFVRKLKKPNPLDAKVRSLLSYFGHLVHIKNSEVLMRQLVDVAFEDRYREVLLRSPSAS